MSLSTGPCTWHRSGKEAMGNVGNPLIWDLVSLLSEFLCAQNPYETIVTKNVLEFPTQNSLYNYRTLEFFALMQRSPATAEGTFWLILEP